MNAIEKLEKNICLITFIKKDGSEREMLCTRLPKYLPEVKGERLHNKSIPVWDIEKDAWRSFKLESLIKCEVI